MKPDDLSEPEKAPPEKKKKIAVLGSAASSVGLTPFDDPEWEIWGCSPANRDLPRVDTWFELHNIEIKYREGLAGWIDWLKTQPKVYLQQPLPEFPGGIAYPLREMVKKYGPYWWTSQIAYMLAWAIEQNPQVLGVYGVDMAADTEYNQQRLACQYFLLVAQSKGITVVVPPESDLLEPPPLYGYCESSRHWRKLYARKLELEGRIQKLAEDERLKANEKAHLIGAMDDLNYHMAHWANRTDFD